MIDITNDEIIKEFESIKQASDYLVKNNLVQCISASNRISKVCRSSDNTKAYGYGWSFIE